MFTFLDVSSYDAVCENPAKRGTFLWDLPVDWSKQVENGARLAFIKSSEYVADPAFLMQWKAAGSVGLCRGAYHFFHPQVNAIAQAQQYVALLNQAGLTWTGSQLGSDKLIVDFETTGIMGAVDAMKALASFYYEVHKALPQFEFVVYSGPGLWNTLVADGASVAWAAPTSLWLATYPRDPTSIWKPAIFNKTSVDDLAKAIVAGRYSNTPLKPWTTVSYRQFTAWADATQVPGHPAVKKVVDVNFCQFDIPLRSMLPPVITPSVPEPAPIPIASWQQSITTWARTQGYIGPDPEAKQ